ncbi:MAG: lysophospholipid acyltransferase family protein [Pseudomonadota bacterium]
MFSTIRWEKIGTESYEADIARGVPRLICFWHEQLVMMPHLREWNDHRAVAMVSRHADAQFMAAHMRNLGVEVIELGTSDVNTGALREAVRLLRNGKTLAITVDGPMGPAREVKPGALVIGGLAGFPVSPCAYQVSRAIRLRTWDRLIIPLPWGRGVVSIGQGFAPKARLSDDEMTAACQRLKSLIDEQEAICVQRLSEKPQKSRKT